MTTPTIPTVLTLTDTQAYAAIVAHGLSIRQIPREVVHLYEMRHHKEGNETVQTKLKDVTPEHYAWLKRQATDPRNYVFNDVTCEVWRVYTKTTTIPNHAGHWMCQQVTGTSSRVEWITKAHHLAPTLAESVALFLAAQSGAGNAKE